MPKKKERKIWKNRHLFLPLQLLRVSDSIQVRSGCNRK